MANANVHMASETTRVIDWRIWKAATVAVDGGPVPPGGVAVKKGDVLCVTSRMSTTAAGRVEFITPSPVSLALSIAVRNAQKAREAFGSLTWKQTPSANPSNWADAESLPALYDYFEHCMVSVTFSFQSLEAFANQLVSEGLHGTMKIQRAKGEVEWDSASIERHVSTEEKLATIIPQLAKLGTPKGTKVGVKNTSQWN
jgi:hypothetical protein